MPNLSNYLKLINENNTSKEDDPTIKIIKKKYKKKRNELLKRKNEAIEKLKDIALDISHDVADDMTERIEKQKKKVRLFFKIKKSLLDKQEVEEIKKVKLSKKGLFVSGIALASIITYMSYKIYKENNKKYIRYCSKLDGEEKELCIKQYRMKSLSKRLAFLTHSLSKCNFSKDPVKCKDKLDEEMLRIREKLRAEAEIAGKKITRQK